MNSQFLSSLLCLFWNTGISKKSWRFQGHSSILKSIFQATAYFRHSFLLQKISCCDLTDLFNKFLDETPMELFQSYKTAVIHL